MSAPATDVQLLVSSRGRSEDGEDLAAREERIRARLARAFPSASRIVVESDDSLPAEDWELRIGTEDRESRPATREERAAVTAAVEAA